MKIDKLVKGTRILTGHEASKREEMRNLLYYTAEIEGFNFIQLPTIQFADIYVDKAGEEVLNQMYTFEDKGGRQLCLPPEGTAIVQLIADKHYKTQKDVKLFYFQPFFRYERPQKGRYREFWQFGLEWVNPSNPQKAEDTLTEIAVDMVSDFTKDFIINRDVKRGLSYYTRDGFEIECESLGAQKQVCGGGTYKQGVGFALGFDRLMLTLND